MAMWGLDDIYEVSDLKLQLIYKNLVESIDNLVTFYITSKELSEAYKLSNNANGTKFHLSNDFHDSATTIIDDFGIMNLIKKGTYLEYLKKNFVVSLCIIFEDTVDRLLELLQINIKESISFNGYNTIYNLKYHSDSVVFRKIYYMINTLSLKLPTFTQGTQTLSMLDEIMVIRHVITHTNSIIVKPNHDKAIWKRHKQNNKIFIPDNSIDDFVHRITLNLKPLFLQIDEQLNTV